MNRMVKLGAQFAVAATILSGCSDSDDGYQLERLVPPSPFHGIHGLTFTADNSLLAGSVLGRAIYKIDVEHSASEIYIGPPEGMADDLEQGPDGSLGWTAFLDGKYFLRAPDGTMKTLAKGLPGLNSTAWSPDGRLFATQVFLGDALYELDPAGEAPPRKIMDSMGGLNGFDFGSDGKLYGPLWFKGQIARVDVDAGTLDVVAEGFKTPAAVNFDSKGNLWTVDTALGHVYRVDIETGEKTLIAEVKPAIDNLAFDRNDHLFISNMADNAIIQIDTETGQSRTIISGELAVAADIALTEEAGEEVLYVGDLFAIRKVRLADGTVEEVGRVFGDDVDYPIGVSVENGRLVAAGWSAGSVQLIEPGTNKSLGVHHHFTTPQDAIALANGDVVVSEFTRGALVRVDGKDWEKRTDVATGLQGPAMMLLAQDGSIYVGEALAGTISRIDLDTGARTVLVEGLSQPEGFALAPDGRLIIAEVGHKRIVAADIATGMIELIKEDLPIGFEGPEGGLVTYVPTGIAVSRNGDIYFSSDIDAAVYRLRKPI